MSKTYFVKLTPTGKFFFGGDMRFGIDGKDGEFSSYIIESSVMPQQTSLLGMMRFLLLSNNNDLFDSENNCIRQSVSVDDLSGEAFDDPLKMLEEMNQMANGQGQIDSTKDMYTQRELIQHLSVQKTQTIDEYIKKCG